MTTLKEKIQEDFKIALKEKKEKKLSVLRLLSCAIMNKEKEKRYKISQENKNLTEEELRKKTQLSEDEILEVIVSEVKKRKEAILEFEKGKRLDLVEKEKKELEILQKYLPEPLSSQEIIKMAKEAIEKIGAKSQKDMGKVMQELMPKLKGRADGSLVSKIVKDLLN